MNMSIEETQWIHHMFRYIHSYALFIDCENWDSEAGKTFKRMFKVSRTDWFINLPIWQKGLLVQKIDHKKKTRSVKIGFCSISNGFRSALSKNLIFFSYSLKVLGEGIIRPVHLIA